MGLHHQIPDIGQPYLVPHPHGLVSCVQDTEWFESKRSKRGGRGGRGGGPSHSSSRPQTASAAIIGNTYEQQAGYGSLGDLGDLEDLSAAAVAFRSQEPVVAPLAAVVPALQGLELEPDEPETGEDGVQEASQVVIWPQQAPQKYAEA